MSDGTHLSTFAGDKQEWPVYMIIDNLSSKIHQTVSTQRDVIVAIQPITIKHRNIPYKWLDGQRLTNWEVLNEVLPQLLSISPLNKIPARAAGITTFFVQMATSGIANLFKQHGM